jgi:O-antigen biosynthesis protein WbqP
MKRPFDLILASILIVILILPMLLIILLIRLTSKGPVFYWSDRVGLANKIYKMPKFRTMRIDTPEIATHLMSNPDQFFSPIGGFLRRTSLDELPQLFSILKGQMSFVGPRPALFNQDDLIALRLENNLDKILPGLTGWAQINGRDELSISEKVLFDIEYMHKKSFWFDLKILILTFVRVMKRKGVSH